MAIPCIQYYFSHIWNIYIILIQFYQSNSILSNISERIAMKLPPLSFSIDCNEGRSIFIQFKSFYYYFALSIYFFHYHIPPLSFSIDCNEGRSIFIQFNSFYFYFALSIYFFHLLLFQLMHLHPI